MRRLARGLAAIIVDKNFAAVSAVADRAVILVKGRVAFSGAMSELKARPEIRQQHLGVYDSRWPVTPQRTNS